MKTFEQYFKDNNINGNIDHSIRATVRESGKVLFYIHPSNISGDTLDFEVEGNNLIPITNDEYGNQLESKYINNKNQHIIYNDNCMIEWWELVDSGIISIHHADLEQENVVFVEIEDLKNIVNSTNNL